MNEGNVKKIATTAGYEAFVIPVSGVCIDNIMRGAASARMELSQRDVLPYNHENISMPLLLIRSYTSRSEDMQESISLKRKTMIGFFWSFTDLMANHGINFIIQIILARLLIPEHFGIIGIIFIFISISNSIVDSGFSQALIRDQNTSQEDYSTVFHFNLFIALVMYGLLYISAHSISVFFEEPQLVENNKSTFLSTHYKFFRNNPKSNAYKEMLISKQ